MTRKEKLKITVGNMCKQHREKLGVKQSQVATETGYSEQNISSFETGRTNNMIIFLWYVNKGLLNGGNDVLLRNIMKRW